MPFVSSSFPCPPFQARQEAAASEVRLPWDLQNGSAEEGQHSSFGQDFGVIEPRHEGTGRLQGSLESELGPDATTSLGNGGGTAEASDIQRKPGSGPGH